MGNNSVIFNDYCQASAKNRMSFFNSRCPGSVWLYTQAAKAESRPAPAGHYTLTSVKGYLTAAVI